MGWVHERVGVKETGDRIEGVCGGEGVDNDDK